MWYKQSLSIGKSEGTIQCTYAILYDAQGNKLFALQRKKLEERVPMDLLIKGSDYKDYRGDNMLIPYTGYGKEGIVLWDTGSKLTDYAATGYIAFDMPLVEATDYSNETLVPAKLLYDAKTYILRTITSSVDRTANIYYFYKGKEIYKRISDIPANQDLIKEYKDNKELTCVYHESRWKKLYETIRDADVVYVKPAAFDWQPTQIGGSNGIEAHSAKVEKARKDLERAKALLIAAGATNIL